MTRGIAQIDQSSLAQHDQPLAVGEYHLVHLRLDVFPLVVAQRLDLDLRVEVANVADHSAMFHRPHVVRRDDVDVAGGGDEDVADRRGIIHRGDLITLHRRLQGADRIDLGYHHAAACITQRGRRTLAHVAEAVHHRHLTGHHHIGAAADAVHQRLAAAIQVIELRLRHAVVDVDRRRQQLAVARHVAQAVDAGGGLFGDPSNILQHLGVLLVHQQRQVAAVVEDHVRRPAVRAAHRLFDAPPELVVAHALPGEHGNAGRGHGRRGMILSGKDVAGRPPHGGAERLEGLDQHRRLHCHVQAADDPGVL